MYKGQTIIRPLVSEKTMKEAEKGKYTFAVSLTSDKKTIKEVIEKKFAVSVMGLMSSRIKGRTKRVGTRRIEVVNPVWKKATVELKKRQKIDIFAVGK